MASAQVDIHLRLRTAADAAPAAAEACAKLNREQLEVLVAWAQALVIRYEQLDPNRLVVVESREIVRP